MSQPLDSKGAALPPVKMHQAPANPSLSPASPTGSQQKNEIKAILKHIPILSRLTEDDRDKLANALERKQYVDKQLIVTQGEAGNGFFIIIKGNVVVSRTGGETIGPHTDSKETVTELARLGPGDFFGEAALLNNSPRLASVTAVGQVQCLYLDRNDFNNIFGNEGKHKIQFAKRKAVSDNTYGHASSAPTDAVREKDSATRTLITRAVRNCVLFMNLDQEHVQRIVDQMYRAEMKAGTNATVQGAAGDNLYVVESGEFHVFVNGVKVAVRSKGTLFGELALMYNSPRAATVTAAVDSAVWVVDRATFRRIVTETSERKYKVYLDFLRKVELLAPLAEYERKKIAEALEEVNVIPGTVIFRQGDEGDAMYIVHTGELSVTKREALTASEQEVTKIRQGGYFGERALLMKETRAATVTALSDCLLLKLDTKAFALLLGPLEDILNAKVRTYDEAKTSPKPAPEEKLPQEIIRKEDLKVVGTLGKGSFGHVQLMQDPKTGKTYALKSVSKAQIVQTGQQAHIISEKKAMEQLIHPFLVRLYATYKDRDRLYFLLEPSLGGELFSLLREKTLFDEDTAKFYAACIVSAFDYMHSKNIIYRDLKPENLLLDELGYIKVTDFGFAKDVSGGMTFTLCGTPDYLAPEIVSGKGHGKGVDWWTLGIFIYEMLASYPPFFDDDPMKTYAKIIDCKVTYPAHFSENAISLISGLLNPKPSQRLGCVKGGADLIRNHPWFAGFDWNALHERRIKSPFTPKINDITDLSNFDNYPEEPDTLEPYVDDGTNWEKDF